MKNLCIKLGPLYSRLAMPEDYAGLNVAQLPGQIRDGLRRHQALTWKAVLQSEKEVIFDTAQTGDGKSQAGQLPALIDQQRALFLFPTNELILDQVRQLDRTLTLFNLKLPYSLIYSQQITEAMEQAHMPTRSSLIRMLFNSSECILGNPDLFHLLSSYHYGSDPDQRENAYQIPANIDYVVFDEFHIFGPPQVIAVMNILNYHKVMFPHRRLKYVFLSATPSSLFQNMLARSGFQVETVEGSYSHETSAGFTAQPIVQPVSLHLHSLSERGAYAWAEEHLEELAAFYESNPASKGVFIVNSVATAKRLLAYYKREFEEKRGIKVGENTGLTSQDEKKRSMEDTTVQLVIATSTVDVGVDFHINLLIFESTGVGTFIQRLGRLGRHLQWNAYRAYALLPDWTVERFATRFSDGEQVERETFLTIVREANEYVTVKADEKPVLPIFQPEQEFRHYATCWGGLQTVHIIVSAETTGRLRFTDTARQLRSQYDAAYGYGPDKHWIGGQVKRYEELAKDEDGGQFILAELNSFRGQSLLACGIYDKANEHFTTYDLFFLLANTTFTPLKEQAFRQMVEQRGLRFGQYRSRHLNLYVRLDSYTEEREAFNLHCDYVLKRELNRVRAYDGFYVQDSRVLAKHLTNEVNKCLGNLQLVCLVVPEKPKAFRRQYKLTPLFPMYQVTDREGIVYSFTFGQAAFLAHSLIFWREKQQGNHDESYIC